MPRIRDHEQQIQESRLDDEERQLLALWNILDGHVPKFRLTSPYDEDYIDGEVMPLAFSDLFIHRFRTSEGIVSYEVMDEVDLLDEDAYIIEEAGQ